MSTWPQLRLMSLWLVVLINITVMTIFTLVTQFIFNTTHFSLAPGLSRKLAPKWVGLFLIEQVISSVAYHISLPDEYGHIHLVFHASSLCGHHEPPPSLPPPIFPVANSSLPEYEVGDILAQHVFHGKLLYLAKWLGYPKFESTWELVKYLANAVRVAMAVCCAVQHATPHSTAQHPCTLQHNATQV